MVLSLWGSQFKSLKDFSKDLKKIAKKMIFQKKLLIETSKIQNQSIFWFYILSYLFFILGLPLAALFKSSGAALATDFWEVSMSPVAIAAYSYTLLMALFAALINGFFGLLLAWVLVRYRFWGRRFLDSAVDLPFALPTSVAGLTLASLYSEKTIFGKFLYSKGCVVLFTPIAVGIAMIFVSFPFVVRAVKPVLQSIEKELEEAAWSLGADSTTTFRKVLFPSVRPSLITGMTLAFSRAVGEYGSIVVVSSNMPEKDLITSVLIFQNLEQYSHRAAAIIGTVMLLLSLTLLLIINTISSANSRSRQ